MIKANAKKLAEAIRLASTALPGRAILPAYEYISLKPYGAGLMVSAVGPEMAIYLPVAGAGTEVSVHAEKALIALEGKSGEVAIKDGRIEWAGGHLAFQKLSTKYTSVDKKKWTPAGTCNGPQTAACLSALSGIVDDSVDLDPFSCAWAADGYIYGGSRSACSRFEAPGAPCFHIHRSKLQKVARLLKEGDEWRVMACESAYLFTCNDFSFTVTKTKQSMPGFKGVFDRATINPGLFDVPLKPSDLASAATSVAQAFGSTSLINLKTSGGILSILHEDKFAQQAVISSDVEFEINFNVAYLVPALLQAERIQMTDGKSPWIITRESSVSLVMPYFYGKP